MYEGYERNLTTDTSLVTLGVYPRNKTEYILIPHVKHRYVQICMVCLVREELCEAFTYTNALHFMGENLYIFGHPSERIVRFYSTTSERRSF